MYDNTQLRLSGILLILGIVLFAGATFAAEPFEKVTFAELYGAIAQNIGLWQLVNILTVVGMVTLTVGFVVLSRTTEAGSRWLQLGAGAFGIATVLWIIEVIVRLTTAQSTALTAAATSPPTSAGLGVGFDLFVLLFLLAGVVGIALMLVGAGDVRLIPPMWSRIGAALTLMSLGLIFVYSWVGGVERVLFYSLILVLLLGIWLTWRSIKRSEKTTL